MINSVSGAQCRAYLEKIGVKNAAVIAKGMRESISQAFEKFTKTVLQVKETYPEMFCIMDMSISCSCKDGSAGEWASFELTVDNKEKAIK